MHPFQLLRFDFKCFWKRKKKKTLEIGAVHLAMNSTPSVSFHRKYVRLSGVIKLKFSINNLRSVKIKSKHLGGLIMSKRIISENIIEKFKIHLCNEEKSNATIEKYVRDVHAFKTFLQGSEVSKENVVLYKKQLISQSYTARSINSMLASLNSFFRFLNWDNTKVKPLKIQKQVYCSEEKELTKAEYTRLINIAKQKGNERLDLILQTICSTGIRVSELQYITVEAVRNGEACVSLKGKTRTVFIIKTLKQKLLRYITKQGIKSGPIFITRNGKPMNRSNIWREMKNLCIEAGVNPNKVFPHNLRHLFARTFYGIEKDIAKLADILGHSSINTTRIYIISTGNEHRQGMEKMQLII